MSVDEDLMMTLWQTEHGKTISIQCRVNSLFLRIHMTCSKRRLFANGDAWTWPRRLLMGPVRRQRLIFTWLKWEMAVVIPSFSSV